MYRLLFCSTGSKVKKQQQRVCVCETKKVSNTKHAWTLLCFLSLPLSPSLSLIRVVFHCILYYDTVLCIVAQVDDEKPINQNSHFVLISLCYNSHDFFFFSAGLPSSLGAGQLLSHFRGLRSLTLMPKANRTSVLHSNNIQQLTSWSI